MPLADAPGLRAAVDALRAARRLLVVTHARPDGDALGSQLALARLLEGAGKSADCVVEGGAPADLSFLPGSARIGASPAEAKGPYDLYVLVDCAGLDRIETMGPAVPAGARVLNIDHHASNPRFGAVNWVEPESASVGEMIHALAAEAGWELDADAATCLYVAILTDTGRFCFPATRPSTHEIAADLLRRGVRPGEVSRRIYASKDMSELRLFAETIRAIRLEKDGKIAWVALTEKMMDDAGAHIAEGQEYVQLLKSIKGVAVAILLRPLAGGKIKVSVRTEPPADASAICAKFGGGGHKRAAGASLDMTLDAAASALVDAASAELRA